MNRVHLLGLALALLGASPAPAQLVVGTVRDQHGAPVAGARVRLVAAGREAGTAESGPDGTFSIAASGDQVRIDCAYCRPTNFAVGSDGVVVAVIRRYDAIRNETPTSDDLAHLPYARIESAIALTPFVLLNQSTRSIPGASLNDRNAYPQSGLIVVNGVPDYDIVAAVTPFNTIPAFSGTSITVSRTEDAYTYGDLANAGTFAISTTGGTSGAVAGADSGARVQGSDDTSDANVAWSDWADGDRRSRVDLAIPHFSFASGDGTLDTGGHSALDGAFSSARASFEKDGTLDTFASAIVDRATYQYQSPYAPASAQWTDVDVSAGVRAHTAIAPFAQVESRTSAGTYWSPAVDDGTMATVLQQTRGVVGVDITQSAYEAEFSLGADAARYAGGYPGTGGATTSAPSASGSLDAKLSPDWTLHLGTDRGYVLQTFLGLYNNDGSTPIDATSLSEATLTYDSESRLRAALTTLTSRDEFGVATSSAGASLAWQIAPQLSLRTWLLRAQANNAPAQTVGSAWLTYETNGIRIDAIWRRDLLDRLPDAHLDGSIGGDLSRRVQWFVGTERRTGIRATDLGIRF